MNTYFICMTQSSNLGDLLINKMLINKLSEFGNVFVDCYNINEDFKKSLFEQNDNLVDVYKEYHVSLKRFDIIGVSRIFKKNNIELYVSSPGPIRQRKLLSLRNLALYFIDYFVKSMGVKHFSIGNCCSGAIYRNEVIDNKYISKYYVRSHKSVNFLSDQSLEAEYIPDLAFLYQPELHHISHLNEKVALINFRDINMPIEQFGSFIRSLYSLLKERNYRIKLFYQVKKDEEFTKRMFSFADNYNVEFVENLVWFDNLDIYKGADVVISNRLHSLLIGADYGAVPCAFISDDDLVSKIKDVFESSFYGYHDSFLMDFANLTKLEFILDNFEIFHNTIQKIVSENRLLCNKSIDKIVDSISI